MKKSTLASILSIVVLIPATLFLGTRLSGRWYYLTCTLVIIETMMLFFLSFESRKPQARELVTLAVMSALAVVGRVAIPIPGFKAITGIIMITGVAFGPQAGFLTGAISVFASNFFMSQGPWTPWQMLAYGMAGFLAGAFFRRKNTDFTAKTMIIMSIFGFLSIVLFVGPLLDCCTIFTTGTTITPAYALTVFASGLAYNVTHGISCGITILLLGKPLLEKLRRLQVKYGMME